MEPLVEPYNMFAQQKQQGYNSYRQQQAIQGQVQGYSPEQFAQGKAAANSQASGYGANPQPVQQPSVTQPAPVQKTTPTKTTPVYTGGSTDPNAGANYLASLLTTPQREEELRKQSVQRQRIMAVGDALRHIGNIFNTVNGAPSQKFSSPVEDERKRYLQEKALRDANNYKYMTYQQAKAAQDAKMRQAERQFQYNAALNAAKMQAQQNQWEAQNKERARQFDQNYAFNQQKWKETSDLNERKFKQQTVHQNTMAGIASKNASTNAARLEWQKTKGGSGSGSGIPPLDTPNGKITPSGRNYNNQIQQMWDYAESQGLVKKSDVQRALAEAGFGKETPENVKRQQVMSLLRNNQALADYAEKRLGWSYGNNSGSTSSTNWDEFADSEDEEDWNNYAVD